jgi:hypothetical protein
MSTAEHNYINILFQQWLQRLLNRSFYKRAIEFTAFHQRYQLWTANGIGLNALRELINQLAEIQSSSRLVGGSNANAAFFGSARGRFYRRHDPDKRG